MDVFTWELGALNDEQNLCWDVGEERDRVDPHHGGGLRAELLPLADEKGQKRGRNSQ